MMIMAASLAPDITCSEKYIARPPVLAALAGPESSAHTGIGDYCRHQVIAFSTPFK